MAFDADPLMRRRTRWSSSWPRARPKAGYVYADCSDQRIQSHLRTGRAIRSPPAAQRWAVRGDRRKLLVRPQKVIHRLLQQGASNHVTSDGTTVMGPDAW